MASREQWTRYVRKWATSGLSAAQFAAKHGISATSLSWWKWRLGAGAKTRSVQRRVSTRSKVPPLSFVEMTVAAPPEEPLELVFPSGAFIRVRTGFSAALLEQLIDVLEKRR